MHNRARTRGPRTRFRRVKALTSDELTQLTHAIAQRIARYLERQGLLERDVEGAWLTSSAGGEEDEAAIHHLLIWKQNRLPPEPACCRKVEGRRKQAYSGKFITPTTCCSDPSGTVAFVLQTGFGLK